jgi:hypothetical protein
MWRIEVNPDKSAAIYFTRSCKPLPPAIQMFGRPIPWVKRVKYLGVTLDRYMSFAPHIREVRNRAYFVLGRYYHLLNKRSKMSLRNKATLYKTCIRPIMTYASVAFSHVSAAKLHRLQAIQNRFLRMATGCPWYIRNVDLHRDFDLPTIKDFCKQAARRYFDLCPHHPNPLVVRAAAYTPDPAPSTANRRPRHILLDRDDDITVANANTDTTPNSRHGTLPRHRTRRTRVRRSGHTISHA